MRAVNRTAVAIALSFSMMVALPGLCTATETSEFSVTNAGTPLSSDRAKYGLIDASGKVVLPEQFEQGVTTFDKSIIAAPYSTATRFSQAISRYLFDLHGHKLIDAPLEQVDSAASGLLAVKRGDLYGYIDSTGKLVIPYKFESAHPFFKEHAITFGKDGLSIINRKGDVVWNYKKDKPTYSNKSGLQVIEIGGSTLMTQTEQSCGLAPLGWFADDEVLKPFADRTNQSQPKYGFANRKGEVVINAIFDGASSFHRDTAMVHVGKDYFFIDTTGKKVCAVNSELLMDYPAFNRGIALFRAAPDVPGVHPSLKSLLHQYYGALDKNGKICIKPEYLYLWNGGDDNGQFLAVKETEDGQGTAFGFIDKNGRTTLPFIYSWAGEFKDNLATFTKGKVVSEFLPHEKATVAEVKALDEAIRSKITKATGDLKPFRPWRIEASILVEGGASMRLVLGPADKHERNYLINKLDQTKDLPRPKALKDMGMTFEYVVLTSGEIVAAGTASDPFNQKREQLKKLAQDTNYSYRMTSVSELEEYLKHGSELEISLGLRTDGYENYTKNLTRFYAKCGRIKEALETIENIRVVEDFSADDLSAEVFQTAAMWPELTRVLEKKCNTLIGSNFKDSLYQYLLRLADVYCMQNKFGLADSTYQKAIAVIDTKVVAEDDLAKQASRTIPFAALNRYACFLATQGKLAKSAAIAEQMFSCQQPGVALNIIATNSDDLQTDTYLAILREKDQKMFEHFNALRQKQLPTHDQSIKGLVKTDGSEINAEQFQNLTDAPLIFSEGLAVAQDFYSKRYGYVDLSGNWVIPPKFFSAFPFTNGTAFAKPADGLFPIDQFGMQNNYTIIDKSGNELAATEFNTMTNFADVIMRQGNGIYTVTQNSSDELLHLSCLVNSDGQVLYKGRIYDGNSAASGPSSIHKFIVSGWNNGSGLAEPLGYWQEFHLSRNATGKIEAVNAVGLRTFQETINGQSLTGYKDLEGKIVIPAVFQTGSMFHDGLAAVTASNGRQMFITEDGSNAFAATYDRVQDFNGKAAAVSLNGKSFLIDKTGKKISSSYRSLEAIAVGFFKIIDDNNNAGLLSEDGQLIVQPQNIGLRAPREGLIAFSKDGNWGFMDMTGKEVIAPKYSEVGDFHQGHAFFKIGKLQ